MILNEFDAYQAALRKINLNEEVMPIYRGKVLTENVDTYYKIQKLLACNHLEGAHRWLYDLDIENLDESEINKVCNLYNLGVERGFIQDDETEDEIEDSTEDSENNEKTNEDDLMKDDIVLPVKDPAPAMPAIKLTPEMPTSAYTVVYSAMRDGQIKTGEAYSNSLNTRSAKADVISKLEKAGYQNISILAIEAGDPDMSGCDNTFCKQAEIPAYENEDDVNEEETTPLRHAFKPFGYNTSSANVSAQDEVKFTLTEDEAKEEVKKAYDAASKEADKLDLDDKETIKKYLDDNKKEIEELKKKLEPKTQKQLDSILKYLNNLDNDKVAEHDESIDEAKKPSTGLKQIAKGLIKLLMTIIKLAGLGIGLGGKLITWISKLIATGADKINVAVGESDKQVNEEDEETSDDSSEEENDDSSENDSKEDEDKKEEDVEEPDEKIKDDAKEEEGKEDASDDKEEDELSNDEKNTLKDSYKKAFKATMQKCKYFDKSFNDLTLDEKVKFFETINNAWKDKADPSKFMSDKELETLEKVVIKK